MRPTFLTLPLEIRLQIYEYVQPRKFIVPVRPSLQRFSDNDDLEPDDTAQWQLLDVCCQVRFEAAPTFFHSFHIGSNSETPLPDSLRPYYQACIKEIIFTLDDTGDEMFRQFWLGDQTHLRRLQTYKLVSETA